ncbi:hypothetical protein DFJ58DRAFT_732676 [Suillus subalutaceus]|uniref:uncharacterized protein n=1 Tax=Suillus subalutaceus TaxID=48586 RepID=UPI001B886937|nr:uncharacterized protein DFJ58DRAFT_732676 [Suillus subalutaceus]KAG1840924.1 hypothetical protein DFJ58DRAFT_732676 [Suillus subalutaceus]
MSVVNSIIHTSPLQANEGIGFTPVFLSISFQGSTAQSAQSNFGTIPLQVTILWPREFGGQAVPVIRHISWTELVSNFESQSVPQLMGPLYNPGQCWTEPQSPQRGLSLCSSVQSRTV